MEVMLPVTPDASSILSRLFEAMQQGEWTIVAAMAIWLFVFLVKILWGRWAQLEGLKPVLPWIAVVVSVLAVVAGGLVEGAAWTKIAGTSVAAAGAGLAAVGLDQTLIQKLLRLFSPAAKEEKRLKTVIATAHKTGSLNLADLGEGITVFDAKPGEWAS
jgi:hypothetical protein